MIIPIRCFTCGKILADKWATYLEMVRSDADYSKNMNIINLESENITKTPEGKALDKLGLKRYCCRRHLITHVDLIEII
tara:strand:+ start:29 stop:265 length:237 start_codon:yes stop_codon:yes gene_type:complete